MAKKRKVLLEGPEQYDPRMGSSDSDETAEFIKAKLMLMTAMAEMDITPDEYAAFLADKKQLTELKKSFTSMADDFGFDFDPSELLFDRPVEESHAIPDADKKSLQLKVQMNDVTKPPMWREIVIPADINFLQLHYAIQAVMGLEDCHLWQFQRKAYNPDLQIAMPVDDEMGFGVDDYTHDAQETPVTGFLSKKGDKLEYVYDFGDDWIFTVKVVDVIDRDGDVAVCTKWKCDFQPLEDSGGVWTYLELRDIFSEPDKLTAKQKRELADRFGFENFRQLSMWVNDAKFDLEHVNEQLARIL